MMDFTDDVVVVTGAAAGIGLGIAEHFYQAGAKVALGDFRPDALERAMAAFPDQSRAYAGVVDVRDPDAVADFFAAAEQALGSVTVAVANAGIYPNTPVLEMSVEEWDAVMETNARGVFLTCQAAARSMVQRAAGGKIITISSGNYRAARRGAAHYCASKAAVVMFTKALALELAEHRINVNCVSPGLIEVNSEVSPISDEYKQALTDNIPWGRIGQPSDIAHAVAFLASANADFITGEVVCVDGGSLAGRAFLPLSRP